MMTALSALVRKDLRIYFGDRRAMIMSFAVPIAIGSFFGYIFGGNGSPGKANTSKIEIVAIDNDRSDISKEILRQLGESKTLDVKPASIDEARAAVKKGSASVAIVIPEHFGEAAGRAFFSSSEKPAIGFLFDPSRGPEQAMVQGVLTGAVMQAVSKQMFSGKMGRDMTSQTLAAMGPNAPPGLAGFLKAVNQWNEQNAASGTASTGMNMPYQIHEEAITARKDVAYNGYAHSFGGMGVQFILFMGIDAGIAILLQRHRGLWKRLRAAPVSRALLLGARTLSSAIISMLIFVVIFGFARVVFGVRIEGSVAGFLAVCAAFSLMTATFGLLIAALGRTPEATRGIATFATLILVMLGGAWVPSFVFPQWLQTVTMAMPTRWAMDALDGTVWRGLGLSSVIWPVAGLLGTAVVFAVLAVSRFRWETD